MYKYRKYVAKLIEESQVQNDTITEHEVNLKNILRQRSAVEYKALKAICKTTVHYFIWSNFFVILILITHYYTSVFFKIFTKRVHLFTNFNS